MHPQPHQPEPRFEVYETVETKHGVGDVCAVLPKHDGERQYAVRFDGRPSKLFRAAELRSVPLESAS